MTTTEAARQHADVATALPLGRRASCGTVRWYFVRCHEGQETRACSDVRKLVSPSLLRDCFVPRKQLLDEHRADQRTTLVPLYRGYFVVATADAPALAQRLASHTVPVRLVGKMESGYAPVASEAQQFLSSVMDKGHVIRASYATLDRGGVHVTSGPLKGHERRIGELDPTSKHARVTVCSDADGTSFSIDVPMDVRVAPEATREAVGGPMVPRRFRGTSLPMGRRTPRGRLRWYLVECPEGTEADMCEVVRASVPAGVLADAYVPRVERIRKVHGEWTKPVASLVSGCFAASTADSAALKAGLEKTGLPLRLVGQGSTFQPLDDDAWGLVQSFMDGTRTIRESRGEVVGDQLRVWSGPLAGRESVVDRYIRRQSLAFVGLGRDQAGEHSLLVPLAIVARR